MSEEGRIAPNARTFALLIDAASRAGLPRFAFDAFDAMRAAGVEVSLVTYNRLIRAAGGDGETTGAAALDASGGVKTARALLAEIVNNTQLEPDVYTYGSVLGTYFPITTHRLPYCPYSYQKGRLASDCLSIHRDIQD
jgi:pentatricopeptide repeat protein|tara:strand:- start:262 stop:675 length:414 start_codon:yes stop_codon:yes gene_type:complete